jgi:hypothetical protein
MDPPVSSSAIFASTSLGLPWTNIWRKTLAALCSGGMPTPFPV